MHWHISHRADTRARVIADRHYSRRTPGAAQFVPPGRCLVLWRYGAYWVTSYQFAQYARHAWPGAMICSAFRREYGDVQASDLIRSALAATRWRWPALPELGMVTFVDAGRVRHKRDPGRCFIRAGFRRCGMTQGGLHALQILPDAWPDACPPHGAQLSIGGAT